MNNNGKPKLHLQGADLPDLYLQDISIVRQHADRNAQPYFSVFMLNGAYFTVSATQQNITTILEGGHRIYEYLQVQGRMQEQEVAISTHYHQRRTADLAS